MIAPAAGGGQDRRQPSEWHTSSCLLSWNNIFVIQSRKTPLREVEVARKRMKEVKDANA
jgi:hypothetical protein